MIKGKAGPPSLSEDVVHKMCKLTKDGIGPSEIGRILNTRRKAISHYLSSNKWKYISDQYGLHQPKTKK